jgi:hypothetical protein
MVPSICYILMANSSLIGLFQISVKLPHEPYKIQVMVGDYIKAHHE